MHTPNPGSDPGRENPDHKTPEPPVAPDMEPVIPQRDPPQPDQPPGGPPPMIARRTR